MRRIGVLAGIAADDPDVQERHTAFLERLQQLGWTDGLNVHIETPLNCRQRCWAFETKRNMQGW
jgi:hypothetical protein